MVSSAQSAVRSEQESVVSPSVYTWYIRLHMWRHLRQVAERVVERLCGSDYDAAAAADFEVEVARLRADRQRRTARLVRARVRVRVRVRVWVRVRIRVRVRGGLG